MGGFKNLRSGGRFLKYRRGRDYRWNLNPSQKTGMVIDLKTGRHLSYLLLVPLFHRRFNVAAAGGEYFLFTAFFLRFLRISRNFEGFSRVSGAFRLIFIP